MATSLVVPTVRIALYLDVPVGLALDFHTYWSQILQSGTVGALAAPMAAADAAFTLASPPPALPGQAPGANLIGQTVFCDGEVMLITGESNGAFSVIRYPNPPLNFLLQAPNQIHAAGATVYSLQYVSPFHWMADDGLWPLAQKVADRLRLSGHAYATSISGTISPTPSAT